MAAIFESLNKSVILTNMPFEIEEERVLRELRISKIRTLDEMSEKNIARYIKKAIDTAYTLIEPKALYRTFRIVKQKNGPPGLEDSPGLFFGKKIAEMMEACDYVTLMVTTIGPALPNMTEELKEAEPTESFYLEHVGGWMADYMAEKVDERITVECNKNGYRTTFRYAPGYGDWTLEAQKDIFRILQPKQIGVSLTDTMIMIPRKSVSAAIGWEPAV